MKFVVVAVVVLGGCTVSEIVEREVGRSTSALTDTQGTDYQGTDYQGTDYQGTDYQGTDYQGTDYQGTDYQGTDYQGNAYGSVTLSSSQGLIVWKQRADLTWEQRFPASICYWNATKTALLGPCTVIDLARTPSPLAGSKLTASFTKRVDGVTTRVTGTMRIGTGPDDLAAVARDTQLAMHPLDGTPAESCAPKVACAANPAGCRASCDVFRYRLYLLDADEKHAYPFCADGGSAYGLRGTWSRTGEYADSTSRFTFACPTGTIAKCMRWGYRPFGSARRSDGRLYPMAEYHQACVRAAAADYCANGRSFTKDGTVVDIYDYGGRGTDADVGFIPPTSTGMYTNNVFLWESTFDRFGATALDHVRYDETSERMQDPAFGCPDRWWYNGNDDVGANYNREPQYGAIQTVRVAVDNTTSCAHSELTVGKWLDERCNYKCIRLVAQARPYCTDPLDARGWDRGCVDVAKLQCKTSAGTAPMASHSECTTGAALTPYDSACTLAVCSRNSSCCSSSRNGWDETCTSLANAVCQGGSEGRFHGFCATAPSSIPPTDGR